ncbi:MAG: hypothetical protein FWD13_04215 [Treponema sp.]|nr:hypothetical protein [Treponema sp.]
MREAIDICEGRRMFSLNSHSTPYIVRGIWQQNRNSDGSIHSYLPFDCLNADVIWANIKDQYSEKYQSYEVLWQQMQVVIKEGIAPVWAALEIVETNSTLGCYTGRFPTSGYNAWEWLEFGKIYDCEHGSACFDERDYIALLAITLQNGLAAWEELALGPTIKIGVIDWPAPVGHIQLFGNVTPYGNLMRQLANSVNPDKPLLAGFRYDNYAYNFSNSCACTIFEDDYPHKPHDYAGGMFKLTKGK